MVDILTDHAKKCPILLHNLYNLPSQKIPKAKSKFCQHYWMYDLMSYLLVHCDGPDDHLLGLFPVHVVEAQRINMGGQVTSDLIKHIQVLNFPFPFLANGR